jgi:hypothetical protein
MPRRGTTVKNDYPWQELYEAAILETDDEKLTECLQQAKFAIDARLQVLQMDHEEMTDERHAISDALSGLNVLRRDLEARLRNPPEQRPKPADQNSD